MHAYSILDVREIRNVGLGFFTDNLVQGMGNVSGFTELDGVVRLLRIRNPHGSGEWKGNFSDRSSVWEKLFANKNVNWKESAIDLTSDAVPYQPQSPELKRTMKNDGTFWIDYDSFLMGFHNVDVVLAFQGNHAKSFGSSFPERKSNHRCGRAFELSVVGRQPDEEESYNPTVEVFVMIIQKTKRGAAKGRSDRKVSYKACDVGILVGEQSNSSTASKHGEVDLVDGKFFGVDRNGHIRLTLDRNQANKKLIVMPIAFGSPAATDNERSFVIRVVSDSPLFVQELRHVPKMNEVLQKYCFGERIMALSNAGTSAHRGVQGTKSVIMERKVGKTHLYKVFRIDCLAGGGGTVLIYLVVNDDYLSQLDPSQKEDISFSIEINCRGMICRTFDGIEKHEVISKGKKFEAAWRRFTLSFNGETKSRLLAGCVQGGMDHQMGSIKCIQLKTDSTSTSGPMSKYFSAQEKPKPADSPMKLKCRSKFANYDEYGLFASVDTPPNAFVSECIDLSSTFNNTHHQHFGRQTEPIVLYPDAASMSGQDHSLAAAIAASLETQTYSAAKQNSSTNNHNSFDGEIEKAIALSLKDK